MWTIYKKQRKNTKNKETVDSQYIFQNKLGKASFQDDKPYGYFKDLAGRIPSDKMLRDKAFKIAKNPKYDRYQRALASMFYKFFDKKTSGSSIKNENISNKESAEDLHQLLENLIKEMYNNLL